jgi:hypothetical protein
MAITHAPSFGNNNSETTFLVSIASPLRPPSLNTHATFIYTGHDLSISDSLETVAVSIHIPFSLYLIPHRYTVHSSPSSSRYQLHHPAHPSPAMASSSSNSSNLSIKSEAIWEMSPEFDPKAAYEACAPLHWDAKDWDF